MTEKKKKRPAPQPIIPEGVAEDSFTITIAGQTVRVNLRGEILAMDGGHQAEVLDFRPVAKKNSRK